MRKVGIGVLVLYVLLGCSSANAQGYYEFLGPRRSVPDQFTPKYAIRYNTGGFEDPWSNENAEWQKTLKKLRKKGANVTVRESVMNFPGSPLEPGGDTIGEWIDTSFEKVRAQFVACGGELAQRANAVSPEGLSVEVMSTAIYEPYYGIDVAGVYYPGSREIKVLNIYYIWSGKYNGWLRHARDLIEWEMGSFFSTEVGVQAEPRPNGWPCTARRY